MAFLGGGGRKEGLRREAVSHKGTHFHVHSQQIESSGVYNTYKYKCLKIPLLIE